MAGRRRLSQHVRDAHLSAPGHDLLDISDLQELVQRGVQIPLEQLTKSVQVQPWVGQEHHDFQPLQYHATGWQTGHVSRPGAMTEPLQTRSQPIKINSTLSRHPSNADSGYASRPLSTQLETFGYETVPFQDDVYSQSGSFDERLFQNGMHAQGARTVVSENLVSASSGRGMNRPPSLAPCPDCGRLPKNHSDARKHAETHAKRHKCQVPGCGRKEGFATINDLERHRKSVHGAHPAVGNPYGYVCRACVQQPRGKENKFWPRRDNFKAHIKRKHGEWNEADLLELSKSHRPDDPLTIDVEERSVISLQDRTRALSCIEQDEGTWYNAQQYPCTPHLGHQQLQEDLPDMFSASQTQDDSLAAVGSGALDETMFYGDNNLWPVSDNDLILNASWATHGMRNDVPYSANMQSDDIKPDWYQNQETKQIVTHAACPDSASDSKSPRSTQNTRRQSQAPSALQQPSGGHQCPYCSKFTKRECDLKKHMKRHTRPYGCTFPACNKTFGSRNDWKRHESSQHPLPEQWKCCRAKHSPTSSETCQLRPWKNVELLKQHLRSNEHGMKDPRAIQQECNNGRMGKQGLEGWWCGFCNRIIRPTPQQRQQHASSDPIPGAREQRLQHIGDHFDKDFKEIGDWVCAEENKKKRDISQKQQRQAKVRARGSWTKGEEEAEEDEEDELPIYDPSMEEVVGMMELKLEREGQEEEDELDAESFSDDEMMG
ncbi:Putative Zinc finger C2H2-type [Septoria linicola]|uniref:Zinc finger C2H2-type n=1 Tax=Septoria linicola TaxID=215465 RepID=A0A9Q9AM77_9PEZI|nr:putative Zinc finger C2H2-type [Septoria linicola]USW48501.1 Putative Zinc finger C2H2-type [Septoria linicola]